MTHPLASCSPDFANMRIPVLRNDVVALRQKFTERCCQLPATRCIPGEPSSSLFLERDLRAFCCRLVDSTDETAVDDVMHTLLDAAAWRTPIALRGSSDLVPVAHAVHRRLFGSERPFVVCDPRRHEGDGSVRSPPNRRTGLLALDAAMGGSVCLRSNRLPPDFGALAASFRESASLAMLFVCLQGDDPIRDLLRPPITIPSLRERSRDLGFLVSEYFKEACSVLGANDVRPTERIRELVGRSVGSHADLEKTALRLVALASSRNMSQAAERLRMAPVSLSRWLARRRWTVDALREVEECRDRLDDKSAHC